MQVLLRDTIQRSRFAGVREYRLITDPRVFDGDTGQGWPGFGNLVYLADAQLIPGGETGLHDHREIDVISLMASGCLRHEGSLQHGQLLSANQVQVQRAGGSGFSHSEINPDSSRSRLIQMWLLPEASGEPAGYRHYVLNRGGLARVYGGEDARAAFAANTIIDIAWLNSGQSMDVDTPFLAYVVRGRGFANEETVEEGALLRGDQLTFDCADESLLILAHLLS